MIEEFRYYCGEKVIYEVSNLGRVKRNGVIIEPIVMKNGYLRFSKNLVHRAVAQLFIKNPDNKPCIDHIDCVKSNNCVDNLRWVTYSENMLNPITRKQNSERLKGMFAGEKNPRYGVKLSEETKEKIRQKAIGRPGSRLGKKTSVETRARISKARTGYKLSEESLRLRRERMAQKKLLMAV